MNERDEFLRDRLQPGAARAPPLARPSGIPAPRACLRHPPVMHPAPPPPRPGHPLGPPRRPAARPLRPLPPRRHAPPPGPPHQPCRPAGRLPPPASTRQSVPPPGPRHRRPVAEPAILPHGDGAAPTTVGDAVLRLITFGLSNLGPSAAQREGGSVRSGHPDPPARQLQGRRAGQGRRRKDVGGRQRRIALRRTPPARPRRGDRRRHRIRPAEQPYRSARQRPRSGN